MKIQFLALAFLVTVLMGCNSEEPSFSHNTDNASETTISYRVGLDEALKKIEPMMNSLDGVHSTRSSPRTIDDITYIVNNKTRNQGNANNVADTLFYIVNYNDNRGFAILAADKRIPSIMAISNSGNIELSDTINNKAFACWIENITDQSNAAANYYGYTGDFNHADSTYRPPHLGDRVVEMTKYIKPHLDNYASRWGQRAPYNKYSYGNTQQRWALGCGPLAIAQMMSFHKWPNALGNISINWNEITNLFYEYDLSNPNFDKLYRFLAQVQKFSGAYRYKYPVVALTESQLITNITKLGFQPIGQPSKFGTNNMYTKLENEPLLIASDVIDSSIGHMWVMDGQLSYKETWDAYEDGVRFYTMYHCVWGWNGNNNGYFMFKNDGQNLFFDTTDPTKFEEGVDIGYVDSKNFYNIYNLRFWTFTPKK